MKITKNTMLKICTLLSAALGTFILVFCEQCLCKWIGSLFTIASPIISMFIDPIEFGEY